MKAIRLGFIGMGHIPVHAHLPALAPLVETGEVVLQAFCDIKVEALGNRPRHSGRKRSMRPTRRCSDKEELDAVYVCLPPTFAPGRDHHSSR